MLKQPNRRWFLGSLAGVAALFGLTRRSLAKAPDHRIGPYQGTFGRISAQPSTATTGSINWTTPDLEFVAGEGLTVTVVDLPENGNKQVRIELSP